MVIPISYTNYSTNLINIHTDLKLSILSFIIELISSACNLFATTTLLFNYYRRFCIKSITVPFNSLFLRKVYLNTLNSSTRLLLFHPKSVFLMRLGLTGRARISFWVDLSHLGFSFQFRFLHHSMLTL